MGTSYTDYGDLGFWARDETVELWLYLLVTAIDASPAPASWLCETRDDWYTQATGGFQGCVWVGLDAHLARDPDREEQFLALVNDIHAIIASHGEVFPSRMTDTWCIGGGKKLADVDTDIMQRFTDAVVGLLMRRVAWDTAGRVPGIWQRG